MIILDNMKQFEKAYGRWLELDSSKFWAIGTQPFAYRHVHVPLFENLTFDHNSKIPAAFIPMPPSYPEAKMRAGVVCLKNSIWVVHRNFLHLATIQDVLMNYLVINHKRSKRSEPTLSRGHSHNQNDVMINGKKVLGQIYFERGGQTYYGCIINLELSLEDREDLLKGMADDRNFYPDKIANIGGILNEVPDFDKNNFISELENMFMTSEVPEYKKFEVL